MKKTALLFSVLLAGLAPAAGFAAPVKEIVVKGNQRVETATVESYLNVRPGEDYTSARTAETIKSLYQTGLFDSVEVSWQEGRLLVEVKENPLVNRVAFEGNENLSDDKLKDIVSLRARAVYTLGKVQQDVSAVLAAYRHTGRFLAQVEPQIIRRDQNRVDVIYKVDEGAKTKIRSVRFIGNKRFADDDLRSVVRTKESRWWRFLTTSDVYDPDRVEVDKELLRRHYVKHGYADFQVLSAVAELSRDKKDFFITFTLSEGDVYNFGDVAVQVSAQQPELDAANLETVLSVEKGNRYNGELVEKNIDSLVDELGARGFAFLDVSPVAHRNEAQRTVDVTFDIRPGPRVYVNRINIKGNNRTRENVIRRELRLAEGDAFSTTRLQRSRDRLTYLGFFEDVDIERKDSGIPDRMDLDVTVKEQSTGEFSMGAGFSSYEGLLATADVRERNLLGRGQDLTLSFSLSSVRQDFNFSFTEPWFLERELAAGVDLFNQRRDLQQESSYDIGNVGGAFRLGFPIDEFTRNTVRLGFQETEITNVDTGASQFIKREEGKRSTATLGNTFAIDTRDSSLTPTHGYRVALGTDYSGFGSDINYLRGLLSASWHRELKEGWVLSVGGRLGAIGDLSGDLPVYENFQSGGSHLRGFARSGIGPRDRATSDALGGRYLAGNNVELSFPLPGMDELGMNGVIFTDGGMVTEFEDNANVVDTRLYRVSAGAGVFWRSPMGPLRFEFGFPLVSAEEDRTEVFSFSFGARF